MPPCLQDYQLERNQQTAEKNDMIKIAQGNLRLLVQHFDFQNISFRKGIMSGDPHLLGRAT